MRYMREHFCDLIWLLLVHLAESIVSTIGITSRGAWSVHICTKLDSLIGHDLAYTCISLLIGLEITTFQGFTIVILVIVALSILYEGIRTFRDLLMDNFIKLKNHSTLQTGAKTLQVKYASGNDSVTTKLRVTDLESRKQSNELTQETQQVVPQAMELSTPGSSSKSPEVDGIIISKTQWSNCLPLMAATLLHMIDLCLGYTLMLAVMTFNGWILVAVAIGSGVGYLIFSHLKQALREGNYIRSLATNK